MSDNKKIEIANKVIIVILMLFVVILIAVTLLKAFAYFETGQVSNFSLALFFITFLWLNGILIVLKLEQVSLRDRMIDPILVRRLSNTLVFAAIAILVIIILLVVRVFFEALIIKGL